ncbi:MAG: hypothetical protein WCK35_15070 [Chloroflexota bacterium]
MSSETKEHPFNAIILFADLVSSSRMADILSHDEYLDVLEDFQHKGSEVSKQLSEKLERLKGIVQFCEGGIRGEELQIIVGFNEFDELKINQADETNRRLVIRAVIEAALELSLEWFISAKINSSKHAELATLSRIGIGLHFGKVYPFDPLCGKWDHTKWIVTKSDENIHLSAAINFGKRVESASRLSRRIGISFSQSFLTLCVEHGVPIVRGERLESETKGFEYPQPIFDLRQQYVLQTSASLSNNLEKIHHLYENLYHDPNRVEIYYSLAIENIIHKATRKDTDLISQKFLYTQAVNYSKYPIGVSDNPEYFHWLKAILLYRRASTQDAITKKIDIDEAILYYERASQKIAWAYLDLAAAYLYRPSLGVEKIKDLNHARDLLSGLIQQDPLLFHAYNVRALVNAELTKQIQASDNRKEKLLDQALADLNVAKGLNRQPTYLYLGTEATIEKARGKLKKNKLSASHETVMRLTDGAEKELAKAIDENKRLRGVTEDEIPDYHFWRPGFTDPPYHPPRPSSLRNAWIKLRMDD